MAGAMLRAANLRAVGLFLAKFVGGGLISYGTPRLVIAAGMPLDIWIRAAGEWINFAMSLDTATWLASGVVGLILYGGAVWFSRPQGQIGAEKAASTPVPAMRHPTAPARPSPREGQGNPAINALDRTNLDRALYEAFDALVVIGVPAADAMLTRFVHNWEAQYLAQGTASALQEIASVREQAVKLLSTLHDFTYSKYAYFRDDLREALAEGEGSKILQALDAYATVVAAMPESPSVAQLRALLARDQEALSRAIETFSGWLGQSQHRIRQRREALAAN